MSNVQIVATQQAYIVGSPTRPGFNGQGIIDLNDFTGLHPTEFEDCTFSHFEFLDLNTVNLDTENFANLGIREDFEGIDGNRIDELEVSFENNGFETVDWPPSRDSNGEWIDGRGRAQAAINRKERWLPIAVYDCENASISNTVTNGIKGNLGGRPSTKAGYRDIVTAGVHLVNAGELDATRLSDINNWLKKRLELWRYFKPDLITKMSNSIIEESTRDESLILRKKTNAWHSWIERNLELDRNKNEYVLVNASEKSYDTYIQRVWCESILPAIVEGTDPVDIIFYTSVYRPLEARNGLAKSIKKLDNLYNMSFSLVESQLASVNVDLDAFLKATGKQLDSSNKPYNIIGACPQIVASHDYESGELVDVDNY
tara:strand:- start:1577 stop:2692 length:1116 start_codon:yes stop_codon:yes gene_type:complete